MNTSASSNQELVIEAGRGEGHYWRDLWRYRELFLFLAWRDLLVRYKQTVIGVAWSVLRPLLTMIVLTFVFNRVARMESPGVPYPILVFAGVLPWQFFATALQESSNSLVVNKDLIAKVYFPRMIIPTSTVIVALTDLVITLGLMSLMVGYYLVTDQMGSLWGWPLLALPAFILLAFGAAMGTGLWLGALNVKYRDFRYIVPFIVQFGLYLSPVGYLSERIPEPWRVIFSLNPMVGVIDGFRWCLMPGVSPLYAPSLYLAAAMSTLLVFTGIVYFRRVERAFADVI